MKIEMNKRLTEAESKILTVGNGKPIRIVFGGCYTKEELAMIREAMGPQKVGLNPTLIQLVGVETEERPPRPLEELLELYNREVE